ncbi:MAG: hypothetical protein KC457_10655 [Myxococcales bacterium]|nr:hypothetical protein [Myxococcales bacterium]
MSRKLQRRFAAIVRPMREKMFLNEQESETLTQLSDLLLPRLISGELRIPASYSDDPERRSSSA